MSLQDFRQQDINKVKCKQTETNESCAAKRPHQSFFCHGTDYRFVDLQP